MRGTLRGSTSTEHHPGSLLLAMRLARLRHVTRAYDWTASSHRKSYASFASPATIGIPTWPWGCRLSLRRVGRGMPIYHACVNSQFVIKNPLICFRINGQHHKLINGLDLYWAALSNFVFCWTFHRYLVLTSTVFPLATDGKYRTTSSDT